MDRETRQLCRAALRMFVTPFLVQVVLLSLAILVEVHVLDAAGWPFLMSVPVYWFTGWLASMMFGNWLAGRKELVHAR